MPSLSIIGYPDGHHATAQQLFARTPFQALHCADLDREQTLLDALANNDHSLLVYCPPGLALARALEQDSGADSAQTLANWSDKARTLLRHFMLNRKHCTLINELALVHTPGKVLAALAEKNGQVMATEAAPDSEQTPKPLLEALGISLAFTDQQSSSLYRDLETVAEVDGEAAVAQHQANLREALQEIVARQAEPQTSADEPTDQAIDQATDQRIQELQEENELLLLQLHQVQEELEHYFVEYQKLSQTANDSPCPPSQKTYAPAGFPVETLFDLREENILGNNWYDLEHDGCWAGPGTESTLTLPAMGRGRYELIFDIVHALDIRIVKDMQILLNDTPLKLTHKFGKLPFKRFPCQVRAQIDTGSAQQAAWQLQLRFPKTVSPAEKGSDDLRQLTIRLRAIRVRALTNPHQN